MAKRFLWAVLVASMLALLIGKLNADECDPDNPHSTCFAVYQPGLCSLLEPWTYWWGFWGCENRTEGLTAETVTYHFLPDGRVLVEIIREYPGGQRSIVIRELKGQDQ
jgi:hypothetical protein